MIPLRGMSQLVRYEVRDRIAIITVDNPPVNVLEYRRQFGDDWRPSPLPEKLAIERRGFHGDAA